MKHLDLFSGIGGFSLAAERVWPDIEHVFCDNEPFAQAILRKHWPKAQIYGDIRTLTAGAERQRDDAWMTWYNLHHENMHKMQRGEAGICFLPANGSSGMQAVQEQADCKDESTISRRTQGACIAPLLAPIEMPVSKVPTSETRYRVPFARPHRRQRRTWTRDTSPIISVGQKRGIPCRFPGALLQLQSREKGTNELPTPRPRGWRNAALKAAGNAIVPQVAEQIFRAIKALNNL